MGQGGIGEVPRLASRPFVSGIYLYDHAVETYQAAQDRTNITGILVRRLRPGRLNRP